jgi:hypothetical protein
MSSLSSSGRASDKRKELLNAARRSRMNWIMDAGREDPETLEKLLEKSDFGAKAGKADLVSQIPVLDSVKTVLDYLSYVSGDSEFIDVPTMVMSLPEDLANEYDEDDSDNFLDMSDDDTNAMEQYGIDAEQAQLLAEINVATTKASEPIESKSPTIKREKQEDNGIMESKQSPLETLYFPPALEGETNAPFLIFLERLKVQSPEILPIVRSLQSFVAKIRQDAINANLKFDSERTQEDRHRGWARAIADYLLKTQGDMRALPQWAEEPDDVWEQTTLYLEKFLFIKLYPIIFGRDANVVAQDESFFKRLQSLAFLAPEHLDIKSLLRRGRGLEEGELLREGGCDEKVKKETNDEEITKEGGGSDDKMGGAQPWEVTFQEPARHFKLLEASRTPSDIIACLRRVTVSIASALKSARGGDGEPGADELLPMMILTMVRVKPQRMHSLLAYLNNYTAESKMDSETGYLITHLMSAVQFLGDLESSGLTIATQEFEGKMAKCKENAQKQIQAKFAWIREERERRLELEGEKSTKCDEGEAADPAFSSKEEEATFVDAITNTSGDDDKQLLALLSKYTKKHARI